MKLLRYRIVVCLSASLLALLIAEASLRLALSEEVANGNYWGRGAFIADPELGYRHTPGREEHAYRIDVFDITVSISDLSLRQGDLEVQLGFPHAALILGDSFPFGLGVSEDTSFPHPLEREFNPLGIGVINGAQTSYDPSQMLAFGRRLHQTIRADLALLCLFPDNDVEAELFRDHTRIDVVDGYRLSKERALRGTPFDLLRTRSYLFMQLSSRLNERSTRRRRGEFLRFAADARAAALAPTLVVLDEYSRWAASNHLRAAVAVIPDRRRKDRLLPHILRAARDLDLPLLDLGQVAFTTDDYFELDGHWNEAGNAKAAAWLSPRLVQEWAPILSGDAAPEKLP